MIRLKTKFFFITTFTIFLSFPKPRGDSPPSPPLGGGGAYGGGGIVGGGGML